MVTTLARSAGAARHSKCPVAAARPAPGRTPARGQRSVVSARRGRGEPGASGGRLQYLGHGDDDPAALAFWPALLISALEEEFFYRVVLLGWLATRWHWSIALLVSSAVFAVPHGNPVAFLGGLGLGLIYLQSRSLLAAFIAHVAANLVHPWLQWRGIAIDSDLTWQLAWLLAPAFIGFLVGSMLNLMRSRRASTP